jgi:hypothetical protein
MGCSSDEYEDADQLFQEKKEAHSSLRRLGSALHASFRFLLFSPLLNLFHFGVYQHYPLLFANL